MVVAYFSRH